MPAQAEPRTGLQAGALVAGIYHVENKVGEGASGEVWSAINTQNGIRVALKALFSSMIADEEVVARFRREAFFLARAKSDYVAKIYEFINDPVTGMVLVMEFIEGESLAQVFDRRILSVEEAIEVGIDVLCGVVDLHEARIIHRDLKPANLLMQPQRDGRLRAVICDFSLSRLAKRRPRDSSVATALTELTRGDVALGTVRYMAPEQVLNSRQATERSDLYAVGAILFRGVAGVHAFSEYQTIRQIARAKVTGESRALETGRTDPVARGLEAVIAKALRRKPAERFQEATEMRAALLHLASHGEVSSDRDTQHMRVARGPEASGSSSSSERGAALSSVSISAPSSTTPSGSGAARDVSSGGMPTGQLPKLPEEQSVQVTFDSVPPKARRRPVVLLAGGAVAIFAAGIFAGRLWSPGGPGLLPAAAAVADPAGSSSAAAVAVTVAAPRASAALQGSAPTDVHDAAAASASESGAVPAPPSTGSARPGSLDGSVADLEAPTVELPDTPAPEHHHHTAPQTASASSGGEAIPAASAAPSGNGAGATPASGSAEAGAGPSGTSKPEAGTSSAVATAKSKHADDEDFENPYEPAPAPKPQAKPKGDGASAPADGGGSLGF